MRTLKNLLAIVGVFTLAYFFIFAVQDAPSNQNLDKKMINDYNVYALNVPGDLNFAGEKLPLESPDILERMDRELLVNTYWQSNGLLMFKRANKYFPTIEPILEKYNVPEDFKYLAVIESGLQNVTSPAGAKGFWQIMKTTGRENGLEINTNVDERYNLQLATEVACKYLVKAKERFGNWTLAAASYNAGMAGIDKRLKDQGVNNYYDLLLGQETGRYIFRIVALKEILSNPKQYGFNFRNTDLYRTIPTYMVEVDTAVTNFVQFSEKFGINYKILKLHNPWLREKHLNNKSRKKYFIEIPKEGFYTIP